MEVKALKSDILAISKKTGGEIILRLMSKHRKIELNVLRDRTKNNISRSTLFRRLKEMVEKDILLQKRKGPNYGTLYSLPDENVKSINKLLPPPPIHQIEMDFITSKISSTKKMYKIISGIYFLDPVGCWKWEIIEPYAKKLEEDPSELINITRELYDENALMLIDKYLLKAKELIDSQETIVRKGYALGYALHHLDWWCRSYSIDAMGIGSKVKEFKFNFKKAIREHAEEYILKTKPLSEKQKQLREFSDTPLGHIDLWFCEDLETLQQMGFLTEEDVYWLATLKEMGRLFLDCVKKLPREFPKILIETEPYG